MFTGIIQNLGKVKSVRKNGKQVRLTILFQKKETRVIKGESIALNGVCLTAASIDELSFEADLLPETLAATNLGKLKAGDGVNLERSLKQGDSLGGHFVAGHVDGVGKITEIWRRGGNWSLLVHAPKTIISKLAVKGSIACDGVSLTIQELMPQSFRVAVIPHTLKVTTLGKRTTGAEINLEIDMLTRYLGRGTGGSPKNKLSVKKLQALGF